MLASYAYTIVLEREKILKEADRKKPTVIQVCVHNVCLVYHICPADVECQDFKNFLKDKRVKFVTVDFRTDRDVLKEICPRGNNKVVIYISLYHDKCLLFMLELY